MPMPATIYSIAESRWRAGRSIRRYGELVMPFTHDERGRPVYYRGLRGDKRRGEIFMTTRVAALARQGRP